MSRRPSVVLFSSAHVSGDGQLLVPGAALQVALSLETTRPDTCVAASDRRQSEVADNMIDPVVWQGEVAQR